jgi:hypothetical protein
MEALIVIEGLVIILLAVLVAGLLRSHAEILRQLGSLGAGETQETLLPKPGRASALGASTTRSLTGVTPAGDAITIPLTGARGHSLLAFLSTGCSSCLPFWDGLGQKIESEARLVVVTKGPDRESRTDIARLSVPSVPTLMSTDAWNTFQVPASPYFALIDNADGRVIGEGSAATWSKVADMVRRGIGDVRPHRSKSGRTTAARKADVDQELMSAGIEPGDPRLYQPPPT